MTIALWIIAICEVIRLIQNAIQLLMMNKESKMPYMDRATDAFIKSLDRTDEEFFEDIIEKLRKEGE